MKIRLLDGKELIFDKPKKVIEIANEISQNFSKNCLGAIVDKNKYFNWDSIINFDCDIDFVTEKHEIYNSVINYTAKIIVDCALKEIFDQGKIYIEKDNYNKLEFFSYFDTNEKIDNEVLKKIEKRANELIEQNLDFQIKELKDNLSIVENNNYFKNYLQKNKEISVISLNGVDNLNLFLTLKNTKNLYKIELCESTAFQINEDKFVYRIHGLTATSQKQLDEKHQKIEEIKESDHKFIAKNLEIYHLDPLIGQGLPIWLPNGAILKQEIKKYLMEKEFEYDFIQIETPVIGTSELYKISGHWDHYRDDMFAPMKLPKEEMVLKPMSCPHHISVYKFKQRSYRDLPIRYAEHALQHRYESSGSLTGLERVRAMELTDSHIFARKDQVKEEFIRCFNLITEVLETFNIKIDYLSLSLRDPNDKEKYFNDDNMWNNAEEQLENVLKELNINYKKMIGEAAFYGPKLDIQAKTALGHEITVSTIQLDFLQPEKFEITYINEQNELERPIMIHRGLVGTYERFISVLLEQTKGVFPLWCAPQQIEIITVTNNNLEYAQKVRNIFKQNFIRSKIDNRDERLSYKIRDAQVKKIPYQLVLGDKEVNDQTITYRRYGSDKLVTVELNEFIDMINKQIKEKK